MNRTNRLSLIMISALAAATFSPAFAASSSTPLATKIGNIIASPDPYTAGKSNIKIGTQYVLALTGFEKYAKSIILVKYTSGGWQFGLIDVKDLKPADFGAYRLFSKKANTDTYVIGVGRLNGEQLAVKTEGEKTTMVFSKTGYKYP
ncbi:hypothetical protein GCM10022631_34350 [Deinococcus rubellus]|uniref:Uncharacterized protein n=1 Tax=Deinococcus rubellus TaxID=1889240 RepID=A0ABY5YFB4_9DEIO|nr:hypothetical protein [Deinococcus rubellus]UWX63493.1 hypothetical protein N0D28_12175 [Deinococcus rubellus]